MSGRASLLRYVVVVGRSGSIRRAAEELHVSASAIYRQLLRAEAEFGLPLFERLQTGLRLTAAGEMLMASAGQWQKGLADVRSGMDDLRGLRRGHVEIAVIDALSQGMLPALIRRLRTDYPGITVALKVLDNLEVRKAVVAGDVDFGIQLDPQSTRDLSVRAHADVALVS